MAVENTECEHVAKKLAEIKNGFIELMRREKTAFGQL